MIVSNPPFSDTKRIILRLKELNKPFILIMPCSKLTTGYIRENFKNTEDPLHCFWYCWKIGLDRDIVWLD